MRRVSMGLAVLTGVLACAEDRLRLPSSDGGGADCLTLRDLAPEFRLRPRPSYDDEERSGPATVVSTEIWALNIDGGPTLEIEGIAPDIPLGARVYAELELHPFPLSGTGVRLSVYALRASGERGVLALALWSGAAPFASGELGGLAYTTAPTDTRRCPHPCYEAIGLAGRFTYEGVTAEIEGVGGVGPYAVHFAGVEREVTPTCNFDGATSYFVGLVTRDGVDFEVDSSVVDCVALERAACLAEPTCALFGGHGVDYRCTAAQGSCESIPEPAACASTAGCLWTPGDCYCPEDRECECAGGTPPGCRTACETWSPCEPELRRYCEGLDPPDATCGPGPGWCALRGQGECESAQERVCSCQSFGGAGQVVGFSSPCARVEAGYPYVLTSSVCGP